MSSRLPSGNTAKGSSESWKFVVSLWIDHTSLYGSQPAIVFPHTISISTLFCLASGLFCSRMHSELYLKKSLISPCLPVLQANTRQQYMYREGSLEDFSLFAMVDLQLSGSTVRTYRSSLKTFFEKAREPITENAIRNFLCNYNQKHPNKSTYSTMLKALKCYFKRYLRLSIVDSFKFPKQP